MKLPRRYAPILRAALMAFFMGSCMSGIVTYVNVGLTNDFFPRWGHAFVISYMIAMPLTLVFLPVVTKVTNKLTTNVELKG